MDYLDGKDVEITRHDLAKEPPSRELLERLIDESHLDDFINRRSPAFKERNLEGRTLTKKQVIDLMMEEPNLIRRPLVVAGRKAVFGFKPEELDELTGS
jgi:Spx/MgsR family transcriptional regulator